MNIQMKATERYLLVVLFIVLYKGALTCRGGEGVGGSSGAGTRKKRGREVYRGVELKEDAES